MKYWKWSSLSDHADDLQLYPGQVVRATGMFLKSARKPEFPDKTYKEYKENIRNGSCFLFYQQFGLKIASAFFQSWLKF